MKDNIINITVIISLYHRDYIAGIISPELFLGIILLDYITRSNRSQHP